jgi:hypothetical protein
MTDKNERAAAERWMIESGHQTEGCYWSESQELMVQAYIAGREVERVRCLSIFLRALEYGPDMLRKEPALLDRFVRQVRSGEGYPEYRHREPT